MCNNHPLRDRMWHGFIQLETMKRGDMLGVYLTAINQAANSEARGRVYALGGGEPNRDSNVITGMFLFNNRYASMLFDSVVDRSFVSTDFSSLIDISPTTLDINYAVELSDGRVIEFSTLLRGCTLKLLDHPFNIDLMPVELGTFDFIIGMDRPRASLSLADPSDNSLQQYELPDEALFEAWERYKLSIDRCPNHNMLPVTQIDTFYNGLTLRHRDTINAAAGGTFMKRRPEECYDLIQNMTAHHNDWDTSAHRGESSTTSSSSEIAALAH
ncbi:hypothetical protein Tco_0504995 [Tanacetum coccineum]